MDVLRLMIEEGDDGLGCSLLEASEAGTFVHLLKASEKKLSRSYILQAAILNSCFINSILLIRDCS